MAWFSRRNEQPATEQAGPMMPPMARVDLDEIYEHFCELIRPPIALIGRFHRNRTTHLDHAESATTADLERRAPHVRIRAALLNPVLEEKSGFRSGMRDALESAQRRRFGLNPGDFS